MVKDVDGMINRLPAARGSKGPTDGELSALEEEVRRYSAVSTKAAAVVLVISRVARETRSISIFLTCSTTCSIPLAAFLQDKLVLRGAWHLR